MDKIYDHLKQQQDKMMESLKTIVECESPSKDKALSDILSNKLIEIFQQLTGGKATPIQIKDYGNHVRGEFGEGEEQILLVGHYDTVFPAGKIKELPFRVEGNKAYGPGIFDMKGGLIAGIYALKTIKELGIKLDKKVVFLFNSEEEIGSPTSRQYIEEEARKSKYVMVLECAGPNGAVKTMRKGVGMFDLQIKGKAVHSGIDYENGVSAVQELAKQIVYLHGLTDLSKGTTVNVGKIQGGTTYNVVAENASAEIDLRIATHAEAQRVIPQILSVKPFDTRTKVEMTGGLNRPPFERTEGGAGMYKLAKELAAKYLGFELGEVSTGGASDGNFTSSISPTLDGMGAFGEGAHSVTEYIVVDQLPVRSALIALLLANLK